MLRGPQAAADAKAFFVRYLVAYLDKYTVSGGWTPVSSAM